MGKGTGAMRTTIQLELDRLHEERMISVTKDDPEVSDPLWREMVEITKIRPMSEPRDEPSENAEHLIKDNRRDQAIEVVCDAVLKAPQDGDNFEFSGWREVRAILQS